MAKKRQGEAVSKAEQTKLMSDQAVSLAEYAARRLWQPRHYGSRARSLRGFH